MTLSPALWSTATALAAARGPEKKKVNSKKASLLWGRPQPHFCCAAKTYHSPFRRQWHWEALGAEVRYRAASWAIAICHLKEFFNYLV